jgi:DNA polymerase-3 subunit epsilon
VRKIENEALDVDIMHRKLHDTNDKQFSLDQLFTAYNIPLSERNSAAEDAYKTALLFFKIKIKIGIK